jgi:hypothetical protein
MYDHKQTANPTSVVRVGAGAEVPLLVDSVKPVGHRTIAESSISHQDYDAGRKGSYGESVVQTRSNRCHWTVVVLTATAPVPPRVPVHCTRVYQAFGKDTCMLEHLGLA